MSEQPSLIRDELYDERNAFLDLLLGVISLSERTLSTVTDLGGPVAPAEPDPAWTETRRDGGVLR